MAPIGIPTAVRNFREDWGLDPEHPIDLDSLCQTIGTKIIIEPLTGCSAYLAVANGNSTIGIAERIAHQSRAWRNFTIAHELGHFHLHIDSMALAKSFNDDERTLNQWSSDNRQESEANAFAAELLLPRPLVTNHLKTQALDWPSIELLAQKCHASLRATARRCVELSSEAIALVVTDGKNIRWTAKSPSFRAGIQLGRAAHVMPGTTSSDWWPMPASDWLTGRDFNRKSEIQCNSRSPDKLQECLHLLWDESGEVFDADYEEYN